MTGRFTLRLETQANPLSIDEMGDYVVFHQYKIRKAKESIKNRKKQVKRFKERIQKRKSELT